jgi:hypothetical protein
MTRSAAFLKPLPAVLLLLLPAFLPAQTPQTAAELETLLARPAVTLGEAARFILEAAEVLPQGTGPARQGAALPYSKAFARATERGWLPTRGSANAAPDDPATLRDVSLLCMGAFAMRGGFMYALFPNGRNAYRAMVYREFIQGDADPGQTVSGERLLRILGRILNSTGQDRELEGELESRRVAGGNAR